MSRKRYIKKAETSHTKVSERYVQLLLDQCLTVASSENLSSWDTRNMLEFAIKASCFENYGLPNLPPHNLLLTVVVALSVI